jgi:muramoyltetrapeptide carboxypeptidase
MIIPEYLKKGDIVGIVCPAGFMPVDKVSEWCTWYCSEVWGLKVKVGKNRSGLQYNYFSGSDDERLLICQEMMDDPSV